MHFIYQLGMYFPQKHDHIRPQGRPHEKEFKLFLNKNKCHKSWNWQGRWKYGVCIHTSLDMVLKMPKKFIF